MHMNSRSINAGNDTYRLTTKTWKEGAHVDWLDDAPTAVSYTHLTLPTKA